MRLLNFLLKIVDKLLAGLVEQEIESINIKSIFIPKKESVWFIIVIV